MPHSSLVQHTQPPAPPDLAVYPRRPPQPDENGRAIWNWAHNTPLAHAGALAAPLSEEDLRSRIAGSTGRIRVVGSRMSAGRMLQLATDADTLLDLTHLRGMLASTADTATFAAGTPLQDVYAALSATGRTLPSSPGVIASQTLAGALATGTHGQGLRQGSIADSALAIRMVLADGSVREFDREHPWFGAVQLGLGVLGVITAVTLSTQPSLVYTCVKDAVSADTLAIDLVRWNTDHALSKAWWFPDEDQVHVWTAQEATETEAEAYRAGGGVLLERPGTSTAMNRTIDLALEQMRADTRIVDEHDKPFRTVTRFKDYSDVTGDVYQVFCRGIATPQINVEIGVPLARAARVIDALKDWHARTRPRTHYPIILRCTGRSTAWLSPSYQQDTCYFGFVVYYAEDGSLAPDGLSFLRGVEELLATHGGRPHWGKYFDDTRYDWPELFPRWEDFRDVHDALDPGRKFENAFTARLFGTGL